MGVFSKREDPTSNGVNSFHLKFLSVEKIGKTEMA